MHWQTYAYSLSLWLLAVMAVGCGGSAPILNSDDGEQVLGYTPDPPPESTPGSPPAAEAGNNQTVAAGQLVQLDASASTDPDGDELTFAWTQVQGPQVPLGDPSQSATTFTAPASISNETLVFQITASDGTNQSADVVTIDVQPTEVSTPAFQLTMSAVTLPETGFLSVQFQAATLDGQALPSGTYNWDFGDGQMHLGTSVIHTYASPGPYVVSLCLTLAGATAPICTSTTVQAGQASTSQPVVTQPAIEISGYVRNGANGVKGVTVTTTFGVAATTDETGHYSLPIPNGWGGTILAYHNDYTFVPAYKVLGPLGAALGGQDFTATTFQASATPQGASPPQFAIKLTSGQWRVYDGRNAVDDDLVTARVAWVQDNVWELRLTNKTQWVQQVWFPWSDWPLDQESPYNIVYHAQLLGAANVMAKDGSFSGGIYPGEEFAPLIIFSNQQQAKITAAMNWPPRPVRVQSGFNKQAMKYEETLTPGQSRNYRALVAEVAPDASSGVPPWQAAVDLYKPWYQQRIAESGLTPTFSPAMNHANGFINIQLNGWPGIVNANLRDIWAAYGSVLPAMFFWGQNSNYTDPRFKQFTPWDGKTPPASDYRGTPALQVGEQLGYLLDHKFHSRYLPWLPTLADDIVNSGGLIAYYVRPDGSVDTGQYQRLDELQPRENIVAWMRQLETEGGANAVYIDVLGGYMSGDRLFLANLFKSTFTHDAVIEHVTDVLPCGHLISGYVNHPYWYGGPGKTLENLGPGLARITFPQLGRYLLDDHVFFLGESNGGGAAWGSQNDYWVERQAFLLGCKLDAMHPADTPGTFTPPLDRALADMFDLWQQSGWWAREPKYLDRRQVTGIPSGVDVRRFQDKNGVDLLVIENWQQQTDRQFLFKGSPVTVPTTKLSIVIVP